MKSQNFVYLGSETEQLHNEPEPTLTSLLNDQVTTAKPKNGSSITVQKRKNAQTKAPAAKKAKTKVPEVYTEASLYLKHQLLND